MQPKNHSYIEYSRKGYVDKINPEFLGVAVKLAEGKRNSHEIRSHRESIELQVRYF